MEVKYIGDSIIFHCIPISIERRVKNIKWLLNGSLQETINDTIITQTHHRESEIVSGILQFTSLSLDYNNTVIQCQVEYETGSIENSTSVLILLQGWFLSVIAIQINVNHFVYTGTLSAVNFLKISQQNDTIRLNWTAPSSLIDDANIFFCITVVNTSSFVTLYSECEVSVTEFSYPISLLSECHDVSFTVIPVNFVGNGTSRTVNYSEATNRKL